MWKKRSLDEIIQEKRKNRRENIWGAFGVGLLLSFLALFTYHGWKDRKEADRFFVPHDQILHRIPPSFLTGIFTAVTCYYFFSRRRPEMICPKCEKVKYDDGIMICECGGHFEKMEEMKWE